MKASKLRLLFVGKKTVMLFQRKGLCLAGEGVRIIAILLLRDLLPVSLMERYGNCFLLMLLR